MFNLQALKEFLGPLAWFLTLGKSDTAHIRNELQDLLHHTSQSLKSFSEIAEVLYEIKRKQFNMESFGKVYAHCLNNFVGKDSIQQARSHCTDIERDLNRINFKVAQYLHAEWGTWKRLDETFDQLRDSDANFLRFFEDDLKQVKKRLEKIFRLLAADKTDAAWKEYEALRTSLLLDHEQVKEELAKLAEAENYVRRMLT